MNSKIDEIMESWQGQPELQAHAGKHLEVGKPYALLCEKHNFKPGDIVEWKPGLKNDVTPYGKPLVVIKLYDDPSISNEDKGTQYFLEPLDMVCGEINGDDFSEYHYDSRRFQPYTQGGEKNE